MNEESENKASEKNDFSQEVEQLESFLTIGELVSRYSGRAFQEILKEAAINRRSTFISTLAKYCKYFLKVYENFNYDITKNGEYFVLKVVADLAAKEGQTCLFDVGANIGNWTLMAVDIFQNADVRVHCFEISPPTCEQLKQKLQNFSGITINDCGLSDKTGKIQLRHYPDASELSTLVEATQVYPKPQQEAWTPIEARTKTGDLYMHENQIERVHFLKMDVEGSEPLILNGLSQAFANRAIDVVQFEYGKICINTKFLLIDFYKFFYKYGYKVGKIYPNYVDFKDYSWNHEDFIGPNYLAVREGRQDLIAALS